MPRESLENRKTRARKIIKALKKGYPDAHCTLDFENVHQLMVATILSAQCTDERVNKVTPALCAKYTSIEAFAAADQKELEKDIYSTGFYSNKAKAIRNSARQLLDQHEGNIPDNLKDLTKLSGVGRKTGSVILGAGFGRAEGFVVDTHVGRISRLLGLSKEKSPVGVEKDLIKLIPSKDWIVGSHLFISHGRSVCVARRPDCPACSIKKLCPSASL